MIGICVSLQPQTILINDYRRFKSGEIGLYHPGRRRQRRDFGRSDLRTASRHDVWRGPRYEELHRRTQRSVGQRGFRIHHQAGECLWLSFGAQPPSAGRTQPLRERESARGARPFHRRDEPRGRTPHGRKPPLPPLPSSRTWPFVRRRRMRLMP